MPRDEDLGRIVEYLDGELGPEERIAFEVRLANDEELAEAFESFAALDLLQRAAIAARRAPVGDSGSAAATRDEGRPRPALWRRATSLAAAVAALVVTAWGVAHFLSRDGTPAFRVRALASGSTLRGLHQELGWTGDEAGQMPPGFGMRGGGGDEVSTETYYERVQPRIERWVRSSLEGAYQPVHAEYFVLPVRAERESRAVVLLVDETGRLLDAEGGRGGWAYPSAPTWSEDTGRIDARQVVVLPGPSIERRRGPDGDWIVYSPGFLVPRGSGRLHVVVGLREAPLDDDLRTSLASLDLRPGPRRGQAVAERLAGWLKEHGFAVHGLDVLEP